MTALSDHASNVYSQSGEDGALAEIIRRLGVGQSTCVEFGAGDGLSCSNTARLWRHQEWRALLIEPADSLYPRLHSEAQPFPQVRTMHRSVAPSGPGGIDDLLEQAGIEHVDYMSIDVDGDDWWIFSGMAARPRIISIEFNPTIPPHLDIRPRGPGFRMGVGALTMKRTAEERGYRIIGLTDANLWLVRTEDSHAFSDFQVDLRVLLPPDRFMYLATDYDGRMVPLGAQPPWGLAWPPSGTPFVPNQPNLLEVDAADPLDRWMRTVTGTLARIEGRQG
jgi:hypothetical protein